MGEGKSAGKAFGGVRRIALLSVGLIVGMGLYYWQISASGDAMTEVASQLGLKVYQEGRRYELRGRIDEIGVAVDTTAENLAGDTRWYTDFKLYAPDQPYGRIVGASLRQKAIGGMTGAERLSTGDESFDEAVFVEGEPATMLAHLDAEARAAVIAATEAGWELDRFTWSARESGRVTNAKKMRTLLDAGLAAARALRLADDEGAALAERAEQDPSPGVRAAAEAAQNGGSPGWTSTAADSDEPVTAENALDALAELTTPRSLEAALLLATQGDDRQAVRTRLIGAIFAEERIDEVAEALAKIGGPVEGAVLQSVSGQHEAAAKEAIAAIRAREGSPE